MTPILSSPTAFDLQSYLERIEYSEKETKPAYEVLEALHFAHATHIPFENLDILLKRPIRLDIESLQNKLVKNQRGGYCFEHNLLFSAVLQNLGFSVTQLGARVRYRSHSNRIPSRTHMLLLVDIEGEKWIADVGFGAEGLLTPIPFINQKESNQYIWTYRLINEDGKWMLQSFRDGSWWDLYEFTLEPQYQIDYEMASYYVSTYPESPFVRNLTVQQTLPNARKMLRNHNLVIDDGKDLATQPISDDVQLLKVLDETFGLHFPEGTVFDYPEKDT